MPVEPFWGSKVCIAFYIESGYIENYSHNKLHARIELVAHPYLLAWLDASVAECVLTLISAPAGFGKMTLLAEWPASRKSTGVDLLALAWHWHWHWLDQGDNHLGRFWRYVIAACALARIILTLPQLCPA